VRRYRRGRIAGPGGVRSFGTDLAGAGQALPRVIDGALAGFDFRAATGAIWSVVQAGNRLIETERPWELARRESQGEHAAAARLDQLLDSLAGTCRILAAQLAPFLPAGSAALSSQFRTDNGVIAPLAPVFPRLGTAA
jgi:methionyl-tRNA synthetase